MNDGVTMKHALYANRRRKRAKKGRTRSPPAPFDSVYNLSVDRLRSHTGLRFLLSEALVRVLDLITLGRILTCGTWLNMAHVCSLFFLARSLSLRLILTDTVKSETDRVSGSICVQLTRTRCIQREQTGGEGRGT